MKRLGTATTVSLLLLLSACGSEAGSAPPQDGASPTTPASPLSEFLSQGAPEDQEKVWQEREKKVQELTATCMKGEGFEYIPVDQSQMWTDPNAEAWKLSGTREFAEKYGYGIHLNSMTTQPGQEYKDPNQDYIDAMSPSEQEAYWAALYGNQMAMTSAAAPAEPEASESVDESAAEAEATGESTVENTESAAESTEELSVEVSTEAPGEASAAPVDMSQMGCNGQAYEEVNGNQQAIWEDPEVNAMWEEQSRRYEEIMNDPEIVEAKKAWSGCLADKGYPGFDNPDEAQNGLYEEWSELHGISMTFNEDGSSSGTGSDEPKTPSATEVETFKNKEIAQAIVDFDCRVDFTALQQEKSFAMEEKFVEEYREVLTRVRDAQNGTG